MMLALYRTQPHAGRNRAFYVLAECLLLASIGYGQTDQTQLSYKAGPGIDKASVNEAVSKLKEGNLSRIDLLGRGKVVGVAPLLEEQFAQSDEFLDKAKIAQVLVELDYKKDTYWNYLLQLATLALESDEPDPLSFDAQGKDVPGISPEFERWAIANKKDPPSAAADAMYIHPGEVGLLALTEDSRAIPLLRKALAVRNYMTEIAAAQGLIELKDKDSIPFIIEAASKAPASIASLIAGWLVYFDDSRAQAAFDKYVPKEYAQAMRESKAKGVTPLGR